MPDPVTPPASSDPLDLLRSRGYLVILLFGALVGVPVAAASYFFLKFVSETQQWVFSTLPTNLGFDSTPIWWPLPVLVLAGVVVAAAIQYLPGTGGHSPAKGFVHHLAPRSSRISDLHQPVFPIP